MPWQAATVRGREKKIRVAAHVRSGDLCKTCGSRCARDFANGAVSLECPACNGTGKDSFGGLCEHCDDGMFALTRCPREYIGIEITDAINLAAICGSGDWPITGGLLEQSAWFLDLKQTLEGEHNKIDAAKME